MDTWKYVVNQKKKKKKRCFILFFLFKVASVYLDESFARCRHYLNQLHEVVT